MRERSILMSAPMVRSILAGTKTQTRRVVKPAELQRADDIEPHESYPGEWSPWIDGERKATIECPYGVPGDRLWVRETWQAFFEDEVPVDRPRGPRHTMGIPARPDRKSYVYYKADGEILDALWKPSIHMPRWASRITLEITDVRVERLQEISEADAIAEGIERAGDDWRNYGNPMDVCLLPRTSYATLWASINGAGSWDANPWVWAISFRRIGDA